MKLNEQRIARDLSNLDMLEDAARAAALEYFDPYSAHQANVRERHIGVVIYSEKYYANKLPVKDDIPVDAHEKHFLGQYESSQGKFSKQLSKALTSKKVELGSCRIFFLAVPNIDELKILFAKEMGNEHIC